MEGKHLMRFQRETSDFKFLLRLGVDGALLMFAYTYNCLSCSKDMRTSPRQSASHNSDFCKKIASNVVDSAILFNHRGGLVSIPLFRTTSLFEENELVTSGAPFILRLRISFVKCLAIKHDQTWFGHQTC